MSIYKFDICDITRVPEDGFVVGTVKIGIRNNDTAQTGNICEMKVRVTQIEGETLEALEARLLHAASDLCQTAHRIFCSTSLDDMRRQARLPN